ncbi:BspA type Leucine rich repeat region (6 copies) [Popillia japonica]|uniref:BspA type Leucine rich repeat region (6 copies) n=1 Tax=Popillia japonica TaxID=7064 RepID=A0AAW1IC80_POPJA
MVGVNITTIAPNSFSYLNQLTKLDLSNNSIKVMSTASLVSPRLHTVDLSNNSISNIEPNPFHNLNTLIMSHNKIVNASNLIAYCIDLEKLDLSYNFIRTMELTNSCLSLLELRVPHNELTTFRVSSEVPLHLRSLYLSSNKLRDITSKNFQNLKDLSTLDLSCNPILYENNSAANLFQNTIQLEYLNLSSTAMQKLTLGIFTKLYKLVELDLSHNDLSYLPLYK